MLKKILSIIMIMTFVTAVPVYAAPPPETTAEAAVLVEQESGKILYAKNERQRMYPASLTKILTALVTLEHLDPEEMVTAGSEVVAVPIDSSKAGHQRGESLKVINLVRGLIIPSGNETACVAAMVIAKKVSGDINLTYPEAEKIFCGLMNEKAKSLGAVESNFVNPHGYHDPDHFSTAYDMSLISREAMKVPLIRQIASEKEFVGNGAGDDPGPLLKTQVYRWMTHNALIADGENSYPYATGIKTGFTGEAGDCVAASAEKEGRKLIAIVLFSPDPGRWVDAARLFDYGFENFDDRVIQKRDTRMEKVMLAKFQLGRSDNITPVAKGEFIKYMSNEEFDRVEKEIEYNEELVYHPEEDGEDVDNIFRLKAPIDANQAIGKITYRLDDEIIFEDDLLCTVDVPERTFKSDVDYYLNKTKKAVFSVKAIPFWIGGVVLLAGIITLIVVLRKRRHRNYYRLRGRY